MENNKKKLTKTSDMMPDPVEQEEIASVDDFIESLPEEQREVAVKAIRIVQARVFRGPLPPPDVLREYENILPGVAREIFDLTKTQQEHRIKTEQIIISQENHRENLGQWFAFILGGLCIVSSLIATYMGAVKLACLLATPTLLGVIGVFVLKRFPNFLKIKNVEDYRNVE